MLFVGFLCGKCPDGEGVDLTLRQCKRCTIGDAIAVTIIGKSYVHKVLININNVYPYLSDSVIAFFVASLLVLFFNVGIPNELKGCLFFIQVHMACITIPFNQSMHDIGFFFFVLTGCWVCL